MAVRPCVSCEGLVARKNGTAAGCSRVLSCILGTPRPRPLLEAKRPPWGACGRRGDVESGASRWWARLRAALDMPMSVSRFISWIAPSRIPVRTSGRRLWPATSEPG